MSTNNLSNKYDPFSTTGTVELDFPVFRVYWKNGSSAHAPEQGVAYYGGWCADKVKAEEALAAMGNDIPAGFKALTMKNRQGKAYEVLASRQVTVAPFLKRVGWFTNDQGRKYSAHQILAYAAAPDPKTKTFTPWGLVLLTGSSFSGLAVIIALSQWKRKIAPVITDHDKFPIWAHWVTLGTMRADIYTEQRGKGANTSPITPCEFYLRDDKIPLPEFVAKRFIGSDLMAQCAEYRQLSLAWAEYWNEREDAQAEGKETGPMQPPDNYPPEDTVPF